jgi:hypothetical protein
MKSLKGFLMLFLSICLLMVSSAYAEPGFELTGTIELNSFTSNSATAIAFDPSTGHLFLAVASSYVYEITAEGTVINKFTISAQGVPRIDNAGFSIDAVTGHLFFVNGLGAIAYEPILEMTGDGDVVTRFTSPVLEGTGLAIHPDTGNLFVTDVGVTPPGLNIIRELERSGTSYVQVNSIALNSVLGWGDAGLEYNPFTGNIAISGVSDPGVIHDLSPDGSSNEFFDTGTGENISGITFDPQNNRMYVLSLQRKIYIYEPAHTDVSVDIKPGSCTNPLNLSSRGVIPVAIAGMNDLDVAMIDPSSVQLSGAPALRYDIQDVTTPVTDNPASCVSGNLDGITDMTLKFDSRAVIESIEATSGGTLSDGQAVSVQLTGKLLPEYGGTDIQGSDIVTVIKKGR